MTALRAAARLACLGLVAATGCAGPDAHEPASTPDEHEAMHEHGAPHHDLDRWAQTLDDPARDAWQKPDEVVATLAIDEGMVVADVGAGTGYFAQRLSRAVGARGKVLALDVEPDLVARMRRRFDEAGLGNVEARLVSPADPALPPATVDRVLLVDVWHHMRDRVAYATKLRQALTTSGRLVIVDYPPGAPEGPPPELRVSPEAVLGELKAAGFMARVAPETLPRQFVVIGELDPAASR